ncbi:hypothetical protein [Sulfurimonas sp. HSL3-7]|uniref:hypothetical protein n=1 Tax=Sulfonitrofixus jiaomeiensis TaxID=3131938 RepID=UPI0031F8F6FA
MKIFLFIMILMTNLIYASTTTVQYDVDLSAVGTIGKASMSKVQQNGNYVITLHAQAIGIAAKMTKERSDTYISQGTFDGDEFVPDVLVVKRETNDKVKYTVYTFDHINKVVQKENTQIKRVSSNSLDIKSLRIVATEKEEFSFSSKTNEYYARNDIVSLFFNSRHYMASMSAGERKTLRAVGIKSDEGEVMVTLPAKEVSNNDLFGVAIDKDNFENGKGELLVSLDADGFPSIATINDIALYGDVVGKRIYTELASN